MKASLSINTYSRFLRKYSRAIIVVIVILTVFFAFALVRLRFDSDYESMILPPEDEKIQSQDKPQLPPSEFPLGFAIMVDSDDLFNPRLLTAITTAMNKLDAYDEIGAQSFSFQFYNR